MSIFSQILTPNVKKSKIGLSHDVKLSLNMGMLTPILCKEVLPGDSWRTNTEVLCRAAPFLAPIMHRVHVDVHYFYVPNRIIWDEWEDFITGGSEGTAEPVIPRVQLDSDSALLLPQGGLGDYLGIPPIVGFPTGGTYIQVLPFRGYQAIYNEYYRDQTLQAEIDFSKASGTMTIADFTKLAAIKNSCWEKDYYTSSKPWTQRGNEVTIPMSGDITTEYYDSSVVKDGAGNPPTGTGNLGTDSGGDLTGPFTVSGGRIENIEGYDVSGLGITINDLRESNAIQRVLEKAARAGSRYSEQLLAFFGIKNQDARLDRPEYLGGGRQNLVISEVLQTSEEGTTPLGEMAGHGISVGSQNRFMKFFPEHGYVYAIMRILPKTAYQNGIERHWMRDDRFDFALPEFANLGEQAILNQEVYFDEADDGTDNLATFGYQERYAEYKYACDRVCGEFRDSLDFWHMGRQFGATQNLNSAFVTADNPALRVFANSDPQDHHFWCQVYHKIDAMRPLPYYAIPRL
jgi:hypothetical protein